MDAALRASVQRVCARIAPTWPLDRFIAVNPFWGLIDAPLPAVAAKLAALSGAHLLMPRAYFREARAQGALRDEHLQAAIDAHGAAETVAGLWALLDADEPEVVPRARVADVVDQARDLGHEPPWHGFVQQTISQFCAAFFDEGQASLGPARDGGLYPSWRRYAVGDRGPALLMGVKGVRAIAGALPETADALIPAALDALGVRPGDREDYLWSLLLDVNGWAAWCAYRRWTARLAGDDDDAIVHLLAVRLAWEWTLYQLGGEPTARRWALAMAAWPRTDAAAAAARPRDWLLQAALEIAWQTPVIAGLAAGLRAPRPAAPSVQAVFCIDVRSEVIRRALEATVPGIQTLGFAGFFGLPIEYHPLGTAAARPQLPGLLAPRLRATDTGLTPADAARRAGRLATAAAGKAFKGDAVSTFAFVEAFGLKYAVDLLKASFGLGRTPPSDRAGLAPGADPRPRLVATASGEPLDVEARADLALGMLRGMSLTRDFAPTVLLVGHGSATRNNPHAAGLDCGACCGQTGEVNARVAAALLNEPDVRAALARRGVAIPASTRFVAALHTTTTDDIELLEEEAPALAGLAEASARARAERATLLGLAHLDAPALRRALQARSADWSQVRPEWGLTQNAALIVAPRERCQHLDLAGRAFLHDYRHDEDEGEATLALIMTAPLVVAHWINLQYYASTVDNLRYGSGNKVLHNVVGGHIGVFEGNTGDLRIGLPLQSLHDGARWIHTPLRLSVFIEAPRASIDAILDRHPPVCDLVQHGWLTLFQLDVAAAAVYARRPGGWQRA
ncbi:MAG: DUF2309 domain-containing protein [Myxococcales bacterium]|nr:DUF2309 domain-containing protein [Myxococcales bacterium]